jgi:hypothetical protein
VGKAIYLYYVFIVFTGAGDNKRAPERHFWSNYFRALSHFPRLIIIISGWLRNFSAALALWLAVALFGIIFVALGAGGTRFLTFRDFSLRILISIIYAWRRKWDLVRVTL